VGVASVAELRSLQEQGIEAALQQRDLKRQAVWTEALAVGSQEFVGRVSGIYESRRKYVYAEAGIAADLSSWPLHEEPSHYSPFSGAKQAV
jgi:hypothetical protein